jgi:hypothetical protein
MIRYSIFAPYTEFGLGGRIWRVYVLDAERILWSTGNELWPNTRLRRSKTRPSCGKNLQLWIGRRDYGAI